MEIHSAPFAALVLVLIYNRPLSESPSFLSAMQSGLAVWVLDNSDRAGLNEKLAARYGCRYLSMGGNVGLPRAYNRAFEALPAGTEQVVLLDDDTQVPEAFWKEVKRKDLRAVRVPPVYSQQGLLLSPAEARGDLMRAVKTPAEITEMTAINSGLVIPARFLDELRYDERLFLDYADHDLFRKIRRNRIPVKVMDTALVQDFSAENRPSRARFGIFCRDTKVFYEKEPWKGWYVIARHGVGLLRAALSSKKH